MPQEIHPGKDVLANAACIELIRCQNGWLVKNEAHSNHIAAPCTTKLYVFESTAEMARNLPAMLWESGWKLHETVRDGKGRFTSKPQ